MSELHDFFTANVAAAAALLGLLFVGISVSPDTILGATADPEQQARTERAFTALSNVFFVSLVALLPHSTPVLAAVGVLAIAQTAAVGIATYRKSPGARVWRQLGILSLLIYVLEVSFALRTPSDPHALNGLAYTILGLYAYALGVSWQMLGGRSYAKK